jgi:hypothetical protein
VAISAGRSHDPGARGKQHSNQRHGDAESAAQGAEQRAQCLEKLLGNSRPLQGHAHENKQRHGDEGLVEHDAEHPVRETE